MIKVLLRILITDISHFLPVFHINVSSSAAGGDGSFLDATFSLHVFQLKDGQMKELSKGCMSSWYRIRLVLLLPVPLSRCSS
jgi:hypothetical protein